MLNIPTLSTFTALGIATDVIDVWSSPQPTRVLALSDDQMLARLGNGSILIDTLHSEFSALTEDLLALTVTYGREGIVDGCTGCLPSGSIVSSPELGNFTFLACLPASNGELYLIDKLV